MADFIQCPKCRGKDVQLTIIGFSRITFHQCDDGHMRRVWGEGDSQEKEDMSALCACGHRWTPRKLKSFHMHIDRDDGLCDHHLCADEDASTKSGR